jgi:Arc/MetJ-type ribon-helix-helix transcriptional regulator
MIVRKSFSLTQRDVEIIRQIVDKCGYVSDSEALRAALRYFAEHAPCLKTS